MSKEIVSISLHRLDPNVKEKIQGMEHGERSKWACALFQGYFKKEEKGEDLRSMVDREEVRRVVLQVLEEREERDVPGEIPEEGSREVFLGLLDDIMASYEATLKEDVEDE